MARADAALNALNSQDWTGAEVEHDPPRPAMIVHSVRLPDDLGRQLEAEAEARGVRPSTLIRELVERGLRPAGDEDTVTVRVSALRQEIEQAIRRAA